MYEGKKHYFGRIKNAKVVFSPIGIIVQDALENLTSMYDNIKIDKYVIMPNHIHVIMIIKDDGINKLSSVINQFKGNVSRVFKQIIWQVFFMIIL